MSKARLVVLISGSGSNLQAILEACQTQHLQAQVVAVISNQADAFGLNRAKTYKIPTEVLSHTDYPSREDYDQALLSAVTAYQPDLVILAGFMRILTPIFITPLQHKLINIHPSLLPKFKGLHTHERVLASDDTEHGCSVHFVTPSLDSGPIIAQMALRLDKSLSVQALADAILKLEHRLYPICIDWIISGRLVYQPDTLTLDQKLIPPSGIRLYYG